MRVWALSLVAVAVGMGVGVACTFDGERTGPIAVDSSPIADAPLPACAVSSLYQPGTRSGARFALVATELEWMAARDACPAGGQLASLTTNERVLDAEDLVQSGRTWVGLTDDSGSWTWSDGSMATMTQPPWADGRPDRENQHCGALRNTGELDDENCDDTEHYLCECP